MNTIKVFTDTNWRLLAEQKASLVKLIASEDATAWADEHLQGILHWIDALQDAAEKDGFPVVFLTEA